MEKAAWHREDSDGDHRRMGYGELTRDCGGSSAEASPICPRKIRFPHHSQTALPSPRNGEPPSSPASALCFILQILSPAPYFAISRVYAFTVLPLPSFFFPTYASVSVRRKFIPHSSFPQTCTCACWKRLCREPGARIQHGSTSLWSSEMSFPSLQISVVDKEPVEVFGEARTGWFPQTL